MKLCSIALLLLAVAATIATASSVGAGHTINLKLNTPADRLLQAAAAEFTVQLDPSFSSSSSSSSSSDTITLWPFVLFPNTNELVQFGADITLAPNGRLGDDTSFSNHSAKFLFPLARLGQHTVQVFLLGGAKNPFPVPWTVGERLPPGSPIASSNNVTFSVRSNPDVAAAVKRREERRKSGGTKTSTFNIYYEAWMTENNWRWTLAEAIPIAGRYMSMTNYSQDPQQRSLKQHANAAVLMLHALWFVLAGVDVVTFDFTNNCWNKPSWSWDTVPPNVQQIVDASFAAVNFWAHDPEAAGYATHSFVFLYGLNNGPVCPPATLGAQIEYMTARIRAENVTKSQTMYEGKPLLLILDSPNWHGSHALEPPFNAAVAPYTVRWMSTQMQNNHLERQGYWSWMDGTIRPPVTRSDGRNEAQTITNAFFAGGGWLAPAAVATNNGATMILEAQAAQFSKPLFLNLCQWNEFAGQPLNAQRFTDSYNVSLSNDFEPVSRSAPGIQRPGDHAYNGGDGFRWVNLLAAIRDVMDGLPTFFVAVQSPVPWRAVSGDSMTVSFVILGACHDIGTPDGSYRITLFSGKIVDFETQNPTAGGKVVANVPAEAQGQYSVSIGGLSSKLQRGSWNTLMLEALDTNGNGCASTVSLAYDSMSTREKTYKAVDFVPFYF